jgi:hypothetical protein
MESLYRHLIVVLASAIVFVAPTGCSSSSSATTDGGPAGHGGAGAQGGGGAGGSSAGSAGGSSAGSAGGSSGGGAGGGSGAGGAGRDGSADTGADAGTSCGAMFPTCDQSSNGRICSNVGSDGCPRDSICSFIQAGYGWIVDLPEGKPCTQVGQTCSYQYQANGALVPMSFTCDATKVWSRADGGVAGQAGSDGGTDGRDGSGGCGGQTCTSTQFCVYPNPPNCIVPPAGGTCHPPPFCAEVPAICMQSLKCSCLQGRDICSPPGGGTGGACIGISVSGINCG